MLFSSMFRSKYASPESKTFVELKFEYGGKVYTIKRNPPYARKAGLFGKWLVGVCGGFEDDDLEPCGHIFSDMQEYNELTAQKNCISMVEKIMAYWVEQAKRFEN